MSVSNIPDSIGLSIRDGYKFWLLVPEGFDWKLFQQWADKNLQKHVTTGEDCMGMSYDKLTHLYRLHGSSPRWMGFTSREERDSVLAQFPTTRLTPLGPDAIYANSR